MTVDNRLPTAAHALVGKRERRLVDQIFTSWNPLMTWVRGIGAYRAAA